MSEREVHRALSSEARVEMLKLVYVKPHSIEEIAEGLKLQPVTIRHHIQTLLEAGLLESFEERSGSAGRPKTLYKVAKTLPVITFPARRYLDFSKAMVNIVLTTWGKTKTDKVLGQVGHEMGIQTTKSLEEMYRVKEWTPDAFAEFCIGQYLQEVGTRPEIVTKTKDKIVYRTHNCVFYELAQQMPGLMCDVLHNKFHQALLEAMGNNIKGIQTTCMGHGDSYCEHIVEWTTTSKKKSSAKKIAESS